MATITHMKRAFAAIAAVAAVAGVAACGEHKEATAFTVTGSFVGHTFDPSGIAPHQSCKYYDGTVSVGDQIVARAADGSILGKGTMEEAMIDEGPVCSFSFTIPDVKFGESGYTLTVAPFDPVVLSEAEITNALLSLNVRTEIDAVSKGQNQQITVSGT